MNGKPLRIGDLRLENPFLLAPMAGVTDAPFRRICREFGAAMVFSEMISGKGLWYHSKNTERLLATYEDEKPLAYQIFGCEPEIIAFAAGFLSDGENAAIDLNMGCPTPKIVKNGEGAALLKTPELAGKLAEAAVSASVKPVTAKIRVGWDAGSVNAVEMAKILEGAGVAAVTVHGRTREQYYSGRADWRAVRDVKAAVNIPVIGNGDVMCGEDAVRMLRETGCDFVMIARGALGNPWIFREAEALWRDGTKPPQPAPAERLEMAARHLGMVAAEKGEYAAVREMRKHAAWYLRGVRGSAGLRGRLNTAASGEDFRRELADFSMSMKRGERP